MWSPRSSLSLSRVAAGTATGARPRRDNPQSKCGIRPARPAHLIAPFPLGPPKEADPPKLPQGAKAVDPPKVQAPAEAAAGSQAGLCQPNLPEGRHRGAALQAARARVFLAPARTALDLPPAPLGLPELPEVPMAALGPPKLQEVPTAPLGAPKPPEGAEAAGSAFDKASGSGVE